MFQTVSLSIIRSFSLYTQQWYMSYWFADSLRAESGRNWFYYKNLSKCTFIWTSNCTFLETRVFLFYAEAYQPAPTIIRYLVHRLKPYWYSMGQTSFMKCRKESASKSDVLCIIWNILSKIWGVILCRLWVFVYKGSSKGSQTSLYAMSHKVSGRIRRAVCENQLLVSSRLYKQIQHLKAERSNPSALGNEGIVFLRNVRKH